jgi:hypothetical protein
MFRRIDSLLLLTLPLVNQSPWIRKVGAGGTAYVSTASLEQDNRMIDKAQQR